MKTEKKLLSSDATNSFLHKVLLSFLCLCCFSILYAQDTQLDTKSVHDSNDAIIKQYIASKGSKAIVFDASNIKQFWVDKTVLSSNGLITISLPSSLESVSYNIQLANVDDSMDCNIEILTYNHDISFSILNKSEEILSNSIRNDSFLDFERFTSTFHLEDADDYLFSLKFSSTVSSSCKIQCIILSFPKNKTRLAFQSLPSIQIVSPPFPLMSSDNISENGDFEIALSGQDLEVFKKNLAESGFSDSYSSSFLFPKRFDLGLSKVNASSPPLLCLCSDDPISGRYSLMVDTTQTNNKAYYVYDKIDKGDYIYWGLIKGLGDKDSNLIIRPCYHDSETKKIVFLDPIQIAIKPNNTYEFKGAVRSRTIKASSFYLYFVGTGKFLFDNLNIIPQN